MEQADGSARRYYLFAMILGCLRMLYCDLLDRCDLVSFLDAHQRAFAAFGGVPRDILYDRMRNVFVRRLAGKTQFTQSPVGLSVHYGFTPRVAPADAPWVKGKIERPMDFIREGFWCGYGFTDLYAANQDLAERLSGSDLDLYVLLHDGQSRPFTVEKRDGVMVEVAYADAGAVKQRLEQSSTSVYTYLDGVILFDPERDVSALRRVARDRLAAFRSSSSTCGQLARWLVSACIKVRAAHEAGDRLKAALVVACTSWELLEAIWALNDLPMPPCGAVLPHLKDLRLLPPGQGGWTECLFRGGESERRAAFLAADDWAIPLLQGRASELEPT